MKPQRAVAGFDSATGMLRALSSFLHGRDFPLLGQYPAGLEPVFDRLFGAVNRLPATAREHLYAWGGWSEAVPPRRLGDISAERLAEWVTGHYPRRRYPAVMIGSSNGAAVHLAAALGVPWLPQTLLIPVRQRGVHADEPGDDLRAALQPARALLDANPELALHHLHDANQDRLMIQHMTYFRVKWLRLAGAYEQFIADVLEPGGSVLVLDCRLRWPTVGVGERHVFQHGALGGASTAEYEQGSERVAAFLTRYGSHRRHWEAPSPDAQRPEAEWGFEPALRDNLVDVARRRGWRLRGIVFDDPQDLSPLVADLYRYWYRRRGIPGDRLFVESFLLLEPWWTLRTGSTPFWMVFNTQPSLAAVARYLDAREAFDEIRLALFSNGVDGIGLAGIDRWRQLLGRARKVGSFVGVDEAAFPRDFASLVRYHRDLAAVRKLYELPEPLSLDDFDAFLTSEQPGPVQVC